ncbi:MAG: hypothetical protein JWO00_22 [Candidatus Parcubacteria bacterium]|nr:hypothetical protein [Candidatus Parcubacteria bacterium]
MQIAVIRKTVAMTPFEKYVGVLPIGRLRSCHAHLKVEIGYNKIDKTSTTG